MNLSKTFKSSLDLGMVSLKILQVKTVNGERGCGPHRGLPGLVEADSPGSSLQRKEVTLADPASGQ